MTRMCPGGPNVLAPTGKLTRASGGIDTTLAAGGGVCHKPASLPAVVVPYVGSLPDRQFPDSRRQA